MAQLGSLDIAGGIVVHLASGIAALTLVLTLGREEIQIVTPPPWILCNRCRAPVVWLVGFNAGSALSAGNLAVSAMIVTNTPAAVDMLAWIITIKLKLVNRPCWAHYPAQ